MSTIGLRQLEALMPEVIHSDSDGFLRDRGFVFDDVGLWCGNMALSALDSLDIGEGHPRYHELGQAITTSVLCAFEMGVRAHVLLSTRDAETSD